MPNLSREVVKTIQSMLSAEFPNVDDDGVWGAATEQAYRSASSRLRTYVDQTILDEYGITKIDSRITVSAEVRKPLVHQRPASTTSWNRAKTLTNVSNVRSLIQQVCSEYGVPFDTAYRIAWLESKLDPNAKSPTGAIGVFQLTSIARADIAKRGHYVITNPYDPVQNVTGGIIYIKLVAHDMGVSLDEGPRVYMGFNIGATGAKQVLAGKATTVAKLIDQQAYGGPAVYAANLTRAVNSVVV